MKPITQSRLFFSCPCCDKQIEKVKDEGQFQIWSERDPTEVRVCSPCSEKLTSTVLSFIVSKINPDLPRF